MRMKKDNFALVKTGDILYYLDKQVTVYGTIDGILGAYIINLMTEDGLLITINKHGSTHYGLPQVVFFEPMKQIKMEIYHENLRCGRHPHRLAEAIVQLCNEYDSGHLQENGD